MCSETSRRVLFSHDLIIGPTTEPNQSRRDTMLLEPCPDFEFNICGSIEQQYSSADELFVNGMILPVHLQEKKLVKKCDVSLPPRPKSSTVDDLKKEHMEEKPQSKSFWGFKSSSLYCDIRKSLICSFPLLSRSKSTSSLKSNRSSSVKDGHKHSSPKLSSLSSSSSSCSSCNGYQFPQKPPSKQNNGNHYSYGNGVRISPALNVPPPYISKGTASLFGLGSLLHNAKVKKGKK